MTEEIVKWMFIVGFMLIFTGILLLVFEGV